MASNGSHQLQGEVGQALTISMIVMVVVVPPDCSDTQLLFWPSRNQTNAASHPDQDLLNKNMIYGISKYNKARAGAEENYHDNYIRQQV